MAYGIDIVLPAPLLEMTATINYQEVRQASGVAYIVLLFIRDSQDRDFLIHEKLNSIGVPARLHYIFAAEISRMSDADIVKISDSSSRNGEPFNENLFREYRIGDLELTEKGRKLLQEGMLPTGQTKQKQVMASLSFPDRRLDFSGNFSGIIAPDSRNDASGELAGFLNELPRYDYDAEEVRNMLTGFCVSHQADRNIGLVKKEVIDSADITEAEQVFSRIPAVFSAEYAADGCFFAVTAGAEELDGFLFKYLGGDNITRALRLMNGMGGLRRELAIPEDRELMNLRDLPSAVLKTLRFKAGSPESGTAFLLYAQAAGDFFSGRRQSGTALEVSDSLMNGLPYRPLFLKTDREGHLLGCVPVAAQLKSRASWGPLAGMELSCDLMAEYGVAYDDAREQLIRIMADYFAREKENAAGTLTGFFSIFDDAEGVCLSVQGAAGDETERIDCFAALCRRMTGDRTDFAGRVKSVIREQRWNSLYEHARTMIINDDEIKDNIIYLTPLILNIAGFIGEAETGIFADFRSISDKSGAPETEQYYYFRELGFSEEAVLSLIDPVKSLDIMKAEPRGQGTALDSLLTAVSGLRGLESDLGAAFLNSPDQLSRVNWTPDLRDRCLKCLHLIRKNLEEARPLAALAAEKIRIFRGITDTIETAARRFSGKNAGQSRKNGGGGRNDGNKASRNAGQMKKKGSGK